MAYVAGDCNGPRWTKVRKVFLFGKNTKGKVTVVLRSQLF
jgi:hypothetical protein